MILGIRKNAALVRGFEPQSRWSYFADPGSRAIPRLKNSAVFHRVRSSWARFDHGISLHKTVCTVDALLENAFVPALLAVLILLSCAISDALAAQPRTVLVLPFPATSGHKDLETFADHVEKRLRAGIVPRNDSFVIESERKTEQLLEGRAAPADDREARAIGKESGADLVVYGFLAQEGPLYHMRAVMWDVQADRAMVSTDLKVDNIHRLPGILEVFVNSINTHLHGAPALPFYRTEPSGGTGGGSHAGRPSNVVSLPRNGGPWRSPDIPAAISALDIGDLDGDKKQETVFLEEGRLTISRFENGGLRQLAQFSQPPAGYISTEVADLDGDGIAELLLCYQTPLGLESAIARYTNRNFRIEAKFPNVILRAIRDSDDEKTRILVGQRTDEENLFSGEMIRYHVQGSDVAPAGRVALPPGTLLPSYVAGKLGKKGEFLRVILNQDQKLMVFDTENRLLASVADRIYGLERRIRLPLKTGRKEITYPGTLLIADTDGDGENELLVIKQAVDGSMIQALVWDGTQLAEKWRTVTSPGLISDFRVGDFKNQGTRSLVLILMKPGAFPFLAGPRSVVFAYDIFP
ncbi:MAG: VCBS repeat-containing protein [Desulfomonile tiedjei]|nr:VCBS repeat-containing protein [Desulfomonile tiedjei]